MDRRKFLLALAGVACIPIAAVRLLGSWSLQQPNTEIVLRTCWRWDRKNHEVRTVRLYELQQDDVFALSEFGGVYVKATDGQDWHIASGSPYMNRDGIWCIDAIPYQKDGECAASA